MAALEARHWWFRGTRAVLLDWFDRALRAPCPESNPPIILDVGAGTGHTTRCLAERGHVLALDRSPLALRLARNGNPPPDGSFGVSSVCSDACRLPLASGLADAICAFDVVEHLADDAAALAEMARVLRPGGFALISVPAHQWLWSPHDEALGHRRRYSRSALASVIRGAPLVLERMSYYNAALFPAAAAYRLARRALDSSLGPPRTAAPSDLRATPEPLNAALSALLGAERFWLRRGPIPMGLSLVALARRPAAVRPCT